MVKLKIPTQIAPSMFKMFDLLKFSNFPEPLDRRVHNPRPVAKKGSRDPSWEMGLRNRLF